MAPPRYACNVMSNAFVILAQTKGKSLEWEPISKWFDGAPHVSARQTRYVGANMVTTFQGRNRKQGAQVFTFHQLKPQTSRIARLLLHIAVKLNGIGRDAMDVKI